MKKLGFNNLYHGSDVLFEQFSLDYLGKNGTSEGYGVYLTDNVKTAYKYTLDTGYIYDVEVELDLPISHERKQLSRPFLKKVLKDLDEMDEFLSNYGDVDYEGFSKVMNRALDSLMQYNDNDLDIVHDIANTHGSFEEVAEILYKYGRYTHSLYQEDNETIIVVFNPKRITIKSVKKPQELI